jgi:hypothetical protein
MRKRNLFCYYSSRKVADEQPAAKPANGGANKKPGGNDDDRKPNRGQRYRGNRTNRKWKESGNGPTHIPKEKFEGRSEDLKGFTYNVANTKGGVPYTRITEEITRYIGEKHTVTATYIRTAVLTLIVPAPPRPTAPIATGTPPVVDPVDQEIFKEKIRMYVKTEAGIETAMKSLYDLIWGQCSESI